MKKTQIQRLCFLVGFFFCTTFMFAQETPIEGIVLSQTDNEPLIGASVAVKGSDYGTMTDIDGRFKINAPTGATLQVRYVGYATKDVIVSGAKSLEILLSENEVVLEGVIVTGYTSQKKADLTGAVSVIEMKDIANVSSANALKALQGRVPGMNISTSGAPDGGATVRIRGIGTLGNNDPLYIIDGVPSKRSMNELATLDIESIQVLKDASSASIYGSRAANGVIIITTKKGEEGKTRVEVNASLSAQFYSSTMKMLNTDQRGYVQWQAAMNDGVEPNFGPYSFKWHNNNGIPTLDQIILPEFLDDKKTMRPANTNWMDEVGRTGLVQNYNATLSSGSKDAHSLFSVNYFKNDGTVRGTDFERITARINSDYSLLNGRLKIGENFSVSKVRKSLLDSGHILDLAHQVWSIVPVRTIDGKGWGGPVSSMSDRHNPARLIEDNKQNHEDYVRLFGDVFIDLSILKNLKFRSQLGVDYTGYWQRNMQYTYESGYMNDRTSRLNNYANYGGNWIWSNVLNYNVDLGKHNIDAMVGQEMLRYYYTDISAARDGFAFEDPEYMYMNAGEENRRNGGSATEYSLLSYFGKLNYSFDNRYLASFTVRRDGSSRFGANNRYGTFPAFSVGWRLSEEEFFRENVSFVSNLKMRYGWGQTGNQEIGDFASLGLYDALYGSNPTWSADEGTAYDIKGKGTGQLLSGYRLTQMPNPNLKWETTTQHNAGLDFGFLGEKLSGSFDYFHKETKDILIMPPGIASLGEGSGRVWLNGASMQNAGLEFMLAYNDKIGDVGINVSGNVSTYKNKITKLPEDVINSYAGNGNDQTILGRPLGSLFGYVADGIFQNQEEVDEHVKQTGKGIGRIRYKDLDGDKEITDNDRAWIGKTDPNFFLGLNLGANWKGFDMSMFWNGVIGHRINNGSKRYTDFISFFSGNNYGSRTLDAWSPTNTNSTIPALSLNDNNYESRFSTYFVENATFFKLSNLEIGYTFPTKLTQSMRLSNLRVYALGQNLVTIKKTSGKDGFTGIDPETPGTSYPIPTSITFGVNVAF